MSYTEREFYENKSDRELYKIYAGGFRSTIHEKQWAEQILKEKEFDFQNVEKYRAPWELDKLKQEIENESKGSLMMNHWYNPTLLRLEGVLIISISFIVIGAGVIRSLKSITFIEALPNIIFLLVAIVAGFLLLSYSRSLQKKQKKRDLRISELTRKIDEMD